MRENSTKIFLLLVLLTTIFATCPVKNKKKIIFFGDSITELGVKPKGFIKVLEEKLAHKKVLQNYTLIGAGKSANKVYDLYLRMEEDVIAKKPDIVVIWIGVNDVWHKQSAGTGTDADKFERFYHALIKRFKEKKITAYLCTPAVIGEKQNGANELDKELDKYSDIIRRVAEKNNCQLIDLRQAFKNYIKLHNKENAKQGILTYDGVHLNDAGNRLVADVINKKLNLTFE